MSPDRAPTLSWYRHLGLAWSHRPIWVIKQCSSPVTQPREGRTNQTGVHCFKTEGAGKARGLSAEMEKSLHQWAPIPPLKSSSSWLRQEMHGRQGHHQLACCVLFPWQKFQGSMKTDDTNNNMRYNHQSLVSHILPPLHIISFAPSLFIRKVFLEELASFAHITFYK